MGQRDGNQNRDHNAHRKQNQTGQNGFARTRPLGPAAYRRDQNIAALPDDKAARLCRYAMAF
jgi:hypothetical protein